VCTDISLTRAKGGFNNTQTTLLIIGRVRIDDSVADRRTINTIRNVESMALYTCIHNIKLATYNNYTGLP
jgi:hypothetical protein